METALSVRSCPVTAARHAAARTALASTARRAQPTPLTDPEGQSPQPRQGVRLATGTYQLHKSPRAVSQVVDEHPTEAMP
jgi:hypothetical protein